MDGWMHLKAAVAVLKYIYKPSFKSDLTCLPRTKSMQWVNVKVAR